MKILKDKVAIITGAGQGLGYSYAKNFIENGAKVVIAEYNLETGKKVEKELLKMGGDALFVHCDVSIEKDIKKTVKKTIAKYGKIDILINNAQATKSPSQEIINITEEEMNIAYRTGPLATALFTKEVLPHMIKNGYGRILNSCSDTGIDGMSTFGAYGSAKEAIRGLTRVTAREVGKYGITCNVISPGAMTPAAERWMKVDPEGYKKTMEPVPLQKLGNADTDISPFVAYLCTEEAGFMTGQTIFLDGGHTFGR